ncbi:MAG: PAS domain S-box protein [Scytonema sp. PMC 1069.18]|nr:PAS domain S-box protein [Scytonema sp. PMC 1069.18]MEC4885999.1 PAS domain S-box protein [Scytonema sp. PMC 1070.18]
MIRDYPVQVNQQLELCSGSEYREPEHRADVLIVGDNPDNVLLLEEILKPMSQKLVKSQSGEEALSCVLHQEFAVIIVGVEIPGMEGLTTAGLIRKHRKNQKTPIIFLTAFNYGVTSIFKGCELGTVDYLFQPIVPEILVSKVSLFVNLFKQTQAIQRKASLVVSEREEQLRLAVDVAEIGIWDWDLVTNKLTVSEQYERIFGFEPGTFQLNPDVFFTCIHPDDREKVTQALSIARENKTSYNEDIRVLWSNKNIRLITAKGKFLYDNEGRPTRMMGTIIDITSRKVDTEKQLKAKDELEQKLQESTEELIEINERLQRELFKRERQHRKLREQTELLDLVQDTIITKDLNGIITFWNHSAEELYGFSKEEAVGKEAHELLQSQFPLPLSDINRTLFETGQWEGDILQTKHNGAKVVVHSRWMVQWDLGGRPIRISEIANDISVLQKTEKALHRSEERFRKIFEEGSLGIAIISLSGQIVQVNPMLCQILGYTELELTQKEMTDIIHPDDRSIDKQLAEQLLKAEIPYYKIQTRFFKKNGLLVWVTLTVSVMREQNGKPLFLAMIEDISDCKDLQQELLQKQQLLDGFIKCAPVGMTVLDEQMRYTLVNQALAEMNGISQEAHIGKTPWQILPDLAPKQVQVFQQVLTTGQPVLCCELSGETPKQPGVQRTWLTSYFPIHDRDNQPVRIGIVFVENSDRKAAEIALQESEARFQAFMNHSPAAKWMTDGDGHILYHNTTYERVFQQFMGSGAINGTVCDACFIETAKLSIDRVKYVVQTNQVLETVESALRKDGTLGEFLVCRFPISSQTDQCLVGGVALDITDYKRAEQALKDSEARFRAAAEGSLDAFFVLQSVRNETGRIVDFTLVNLNSKAEDLISAYRERVIGAKLSELFPETYTSKCFDKCVHVVETQKVLHKELRVSIPNIKAEWIQYQIVPLADGVAITARDITESKKSEAELQRANTQLTAWVQELERRNTEIAMLGEMSEILQACLTVEEAYDVLSQLVQPLFPELSGGVFVINSSKRLVDAVATWGDAMLNSQKVFTPNECWALRRGRVHRVDKLHSNLQCKHIHHEACYAESLCVPMMAQGEAMGILYLSSPEQGLITPAIQQLAVTVAEHIALALANLKLHEALEQQSIRDALTGLFNRHYLEESLERELCRAERKQQSMGIIMIDVDHFKRFNDTFGHEAGDTVLRELGTFLKQQVRGSDIVCRYGGEEMVLILLEASLETATQRAEQIRENVKHLIMKNRNQLLGAITLSMGVACFPEHGLTGEAVIQAADAALYRAKQEGRDRVATASDEP